MTTLMAMLTFLIFCLLLLTTGVLPRRSRVSSFERQRQQASGTGSVVLDIRRERLLPDVLSLQRVISALLLVIVVVLLVNVFGWLLGCVLALIVAIEYGAMARISLVQRQAQKLYNRYEASILNFVERAHGALRFVRTTLPDLDVDRRVDSREELVHIISETRGIISTDEKLLLLNSLQFANRQVSEIMTPKGMIDSIPKTELLGPLVLSDLHKTGHSRFPVIDGDIDHVIGMLYVQDLLSLDVKRSVTAEKAMEPRVLYIREDQTLQHALAAFLRTHHLLFIVVNEYRETVGLISLEDTIEALIGRKINDEFDAHDDLRVVAKRNPHGNNHAQKGEDV
jgi:CBS domain containing-hemolysin-like protein